MDKQKSYGKNYDQTKLKHRFSLKFAIITISGCVIAVGVVAIIFGVS